MGERGQFIDALTKEEKEDLLNKKMEEIRRKNAALQKRHELIEADRKAAELAGKAIHPSQSKIELTPEYSSHRDKEGPSGPPRGPARNTPPRRDGAQQPRREGPQSRRDAPNVTSPGGRQDGPPFRKQDGPPRRDGGPQPPHREGPQRGPSQEGPHGGPSRNDAQFHRQTSSDSSDSSSWRPSNRPVAGDSHKYAGPHNKHHMNNAEDNVSERQSSKFARGRGKRLTDAAREQDHDRVRRRPGRPKSMEIPSGRPKSMEITSPVTDGGRPSRPKSMMEVKSPRGDSPPPDPSFNFLADRSRQGPLPDPGRAPVHGQQERHPRNFGGRNFNSIKTRIRTEKEKGPHGGPPRSKMQLSIQMTGKERREYMTWKNERARIDTARVERQKLASGEWKRAWDADKDEKFIANPEPPMNKRTEPGRRPAGRIGSGRFDRGDREDWQSGQDDQPQLPPSKEEIRERPGRGRGGRAPRGRGGFHDNRDVGRKRLSSSQSSDEANRSVEAQNDSLVVKIDNEFAVERGSRENLRGGIKNRRPQREDARKKPVSPRATKPAPAGSDLGNKPGARAPATTAGSTSPVPTITTSTPKPTIKPALKDKDKPLTNGKGAGKGEVKRKVRYEDEVFEQEAKAEKETKPEKEVAPPVIEVEGDIDIVDDDDEDQWVDIDDIEEFYEMKRSMYRQSLQDEDGEYSDDEDAHNSSAESLDRFIRENTLRIDEETGIAAPVSSDSESPAGWGSQMEEYHKDHPMSELSDLQSPTSPEATHPLSNRSDIPLTPGASEEDHAPEFPKVDDSLSLDASADDSALSSGKEEPKEDAAAESTAAVPDASQTSDINSSVQHQPPADNTDYDADCSANSADQSADTSKTEADSSAVSQSGAAEISEQPIATSESEQPIATSESEQPIATSESEQPIATSESEQPVATSESEQPIATSESEQPVATSESEQPIATSESEQPIATSESEQQVATSESEQPIATSESEQPEATSESEQPIATSESEQPIATSESEQPIATSESEQPIATSESKQPLSTSETVNIEAPDKESQLPEASSHPDDKDETGHTQPEASSIAEPTNEEPKKEETIPTGTSEISAES